MPRYEITGCATDVFALGDIQGALVAAGAQSINSRRAFGWSNQPHVATFRATDEREARRICDAARVSLRPGSLPALLPWEYRA